jgi:hypothetical protein
MRVDAQQRLPRELMSDPPLQDRSGSSYTAGTKDYKSDNFTGVVANPISQICSSGILVLQNCWMQVS